MSCTAPVTKAEFIWNIADMYFSNSRVLLCLSAGLDQKQFKDAIIRTFKNLNAPDEGTEFLTNPQGSSSNTNSNLAGCEQGDPASSQATLVPPVPTATSSDNAADAADTSPSAATTSRPTSIVQDLLAERRQPLDREKKDKDTAEEAEKKAKADIKRDAIAANSGSAKAKQVNYAQQQRKRQYEAKLERERILKEIENDKTARKEKEEQRKALARAEAEGNDGADGLIAQQLAQEAAQPRPQTSKDCALQIRLFDGSNIRQRFSSEQTLRSNVRPWIESRRSDGDTPYTFKQILTPLPNRSLSISEEEESLQSLGLSPSATLVMVPVQGYTAAYAGEPGMLSKGVSTGYGLLSTGAGMITGALTTFLGMGSVAPHAEQASPTSSSNAQQTDSFGSRINVRTLRDQHTDKDDQQLYNGNQVSGHSRSLIYLPLI